MLEVPYGLNAYNRLGSEARGQRDICWENASKTIKGFALTITAVMGDWMKMVSFR